MEPIPVVPDSQLVDRLVHGDEEALGELRARHAGSVYATAYAILGNPPDSEHVLSETFLEVWRSAVDFTPNVSSVHSWLTDIARRRARGLTRERGRTTWRSPLTLPQTSA